MLLNLTEYSTKTISDQIFDQILRKIIKNELKPGDELEPVGLLAREQHIGKNTVKRVYQELADEDLIEFKNELGYFVKTIEKNKLLALGNDIESSELNSVNRINTYRDSEERQKIEEELKLAQQIQSDLLPNKIINEDRISVLGYIKPSRVVCGDFYDYFKIDENRYGFVIADASGKGMPAAILISQIQAILKSELSNGAMLPEIINKLNNHLIKNSSARNFASLFYGIVDLSGGKLEYVNAGHNFPILVDKSGNFQLLKTTGPALGLVPDFDYSKISVDVKANSTILCYTDGITETMNAEGEQFGEGRIIELLVRNNSSEPKKIIDMVINQVDTFKSEKSINDDRTLMAARIT